MTRGDALLAGLVSAGLMALLVPLASVGVDWLHDGIMLKPALDVLSGQVLFRDTFMQYGALSCYLQVVALWIEPTLLSVRLMTVAAYGVTLFFLYASWRLILPRSLTLISCGLFVLFIPAYEKDYWNNEYWLLLPWSSVFALMFQSIGLYALLRVIRGAQPERWGVVFGAACACVFWCRQPVGVTAFAGLAVIGFAGYCTNWSPADRSTRSILIWVFGGFVAAHTLMLGDIAISGALPEWWYQNIIWPGKWSASMSWGETLVLSVHPTASLGLTLMLLAAAIPTLVRRFRPTLSTHSVAAYFICLGGVLIWQHQRVLRSVALREGGWTLVLPLVVLLVVIIVVALALTSRGKPRTTEYYLITALTAFCLGSLPQYFPMADAWHILWSLAPAFGLFVFVFWRWTGWAVPVVATVLAAIFLPSLVAKTRSGSPVLNQPMVTLASPAVLRGMRVPPAQARSISQIASTTAQILAAQPTISSALIGNEAMFLCFTSNRANPSPYFVTWPGLADNAANQKRWNYISSVRPVMFLHKAKWDAVNDFYRRSHYVPLRYISEEALEIAVPQELADRMGVSAYGVALKRQTDLD